MKKFYTAILLTVLVVSSKMVVAEPIVFSDPTGDARTSSESVELDIRQLTFQYVPNTSTFTIGVAVTNASAELISPSSSPLLISSIKVGISIEDDGIPSGVIGGFYDDIAAEALGEIPVGVSDDIAIDSGTELDNPGFSEAFVISAGEILAAPTDFSGRLVTFSLPVSSLGEARNLRVSAVALSEAEMLDAIVTPLFVVPESTILGCWIGVGSICFVRRRPW